jgi:WD40 repeat protein
LVKVLDARTGAETRSARIASALFVEVSPDGSRAAGLCQPALPPTGPVSPEKVLKVLDLGGGERWAVRGNFSDRVAFSPDGATLAAVEFPGKEGGVLRLYDSATGKERKALPVPWAASLSLSFSPDGARLALGGEALPDTAVLDVVSGREVCRLARRLDAATGQVSFSPDGRRIATADSRGRPATRVNLWDAATGAELLTLKAPGAVSALDFSPDGHRLHALCAAEEGLVLQTWDATPLPGPPHRIGRGGEITP